MSLTIDAPTTQRPLTTTLIYVEEYDSDGWGWWCPKCTRPGVFIGVSGFVSSAKARRAAGKHEDRRGHR